MTDDQAVRPRGGRAPIGALSPGRKSPVMTRRRARELAANASATKTDSSIRAGDDVAAAAVTPAAAAATAAAPPFEEAPLSPPPISAFPVAMGDEEVEDCAAAAAAAVPPLPAPAPAPPLPAAAPTAREVAAAEAARQRLYGNTTASAVVLPSGTPPPVAVDVPLRPNSELEPLSDEQAGGGSESSSVASLLASAVSALAPEKKWDDVARGLELFRRGVKHHRAEALAVLSSALTGIAAAVGSLRSALCRAGIAAASDVAAAFGAEEPWAIVGKASEAGEQTEQQNQLGGLLPCLLSKAASNDKKFVVDAAAAALSVACATVPSELLLPRLLDSLRAKPSLPRGRAAAARALAEVVGKNEAPSIQEALFFDQLEAVASELSRDAWPPARQAARDLAAALARAGKKEEEAGASPSLAAVLPPQQSQQGKENAAAAGARSAAAAALFSAAGKAVNVIEAPAAAPPQQQLVPPPWRQQQQQTLGGAGNV